VVDLFKLYTFDFGHIFIRAIVCKKILLYSELLEVLQNLRTGPHLLPPASRSLFVCSAARRPSPAFSPSCRLLDRRSSYATWPPARPPAARPTALTPTRTNALRRYPPEPPRAPSTASSSLLPARVPLFGFGTRPVNFSLLLFPRAHPHSCSFSFSARLLHRSSSVHHRQPPPPLLLSNFMLHQHRHISLPLPDPLFFLLPHACSPERHAGDLTPRRGPISSRTKVPPLLLPRQEQHHISTLKLPDQFPFTFLHSGRRNTAATLGTSPRRLCL
jgi:hypothetical protein